jgi:nucleotide-binding universal stress UspA family protein
MASHLLGSTEEILVAVDAEGNARHALEEALHLGRTLGRHVHVVHVAEPTGRFSAAIYGRTFEKDRAVALERIRMWIRELPDAEDQAPSVEVVAGHPVQAIAELAGARKPAVLVLGRHGHGRRRDALLGTTAARLVRAAPCPVLIRRQERVDGRPLLVPVDLSRESMAALDGAALLASRTGQRLYTLFVYQPPDFVYGPIDPSVDYAVKAEMTRMIEEYEEAIKARDLPVEPVVQTAEGEPAEQIVLRAGQLKADLIVMGTHGRTGLARWALGSVAEAVVDRSGLSVLCAHIKDRDFRVG